MSDNEQFLARWSRRKREASRAGEVEPQSAGPMGASGPPLPDVSAAEDADPGLDLSGLPPLDAIDAATDITAFLRQGIPQELARAALRRAWAADPAIRDFVGLAENAWDFNDPNAMPGFGPLDYSEAELSALCERIVGAVTQAAEEFPEAQAEAEDEHEPVRPERAALSSAPAPVTVDRSMGDAWGSEASPQESAASQSVTAEAVGFEQTPVRRRTHGGALPR